MNKPFPNNPGNTRGNPGAGSNAAPAKGAPVGRPATAGPGAAIPRATTPAAAGASQGAPRAPRGAAPRPAHGKPAPGASSQAPAPRHTGGAGGGNVPPGAPTTGNGGPSGHWLMVGVFALSAVLGGGLAGLYLAMQDTSTSGDAMVAEQAPAISVITPNRMAAAPARPEQGRAAAPSGAAPATEQPKVQDRIASALATPAAESPAAAATSDSAPAAAEASGAPEASSAPREAGITPGADELKQLTEQVVGALGALGRAEQQGTVEEAAAGAERLRGSLADLVDAALASGKSDEQIRQLVAEALDSAGEGNIPALLRDASGKVDITRLLASVMPPAESAADVPMNAEERAYFDQLAAEAGQTTTEEGTTATAARGASKPAAGNARKARASGRFFVRNGKRYTIIRRGDTLSDIAYAAYGDVLAYSAILRANRGRISTRNLQPGTRILIPELNTTRRAGRAKKRRARRQGAAPAPRRATAATTTRRPARTRRAAARRPADGAAAGAAPAEKKVITLPAGGAPAVDPNKPVQKFTNFRSSRDAQPVPLTPQEHQ